MSNIDAPQNLNVARSTATRAKLISAGRELFAEHGFSTISTEQIVQAAGVTRGALYHHFHDKEDLFAAVYEQVERELTERIATAVARSANRPLERLRLGAELFLEACSRPEVQRITLIDGPSVLGWERWREIGSNYGLGLIEGVLRAALSAGETAELPTSTLAHTLLGAIDELALVMARAKDPERSRSDALRTIDWMVRALRG